MSSRRLEKKMLFYELNCEKHERKGNDKSIQWVTSNQNFLMESKLYYKINTVQKCNF
jgi:hypothetical protein